MTLRPSVFIDPDCFIDDPELFAGLPVVLQLIGRTLEEEGVIAMTEVVDAALKGHRS